MSAPILFLYVWPGRWDLPSIDGDCIEAILHLQLSYPNFYSIIETTDPDLSPSGQLPFLTHGQVTVSSLSSIISYLSSLDLSVLTSADPDEAYESEGEFSKVNLQAGLTAVQLAKTTAWRTYVESQLGDLVAHSFFVLDPNYGMFTRGLLASMLPIPQRYYVPNRIREGHRSRQEAAGLWRLANEPESEESRGAKVDADDDKERKIRHAFGQAKLIERARIVFDLLSRLLDGKSFVFNDRPTAVDLALASRIILLMKAPIPNPALKETLESSYPTLIEHASRTCDLAFPSLPSPSSIQSSIMAPPRINIIALLKSSLVHLRRGASTNNEESDEVKRYRRYRWGWIGLAIAGTVGFAVANGIARFERVDANQEESETILEDNNEPNEEQDDI